MPVYQLDDSLWFPDPNYAWNDGVLAIGGDLSVNRLILAYRMGIFPWFNEHEPILWWSPNPRYVIFPDKLKVSKSMRKIMRDKIFEVTYDTEFKAVITACRDTRRNGQFGTWITDDMLEAYCALHEAGFAHSVEVWQEGELVGGLYGVALGKFFFGESMFAKVSNASKTGFIQLVRQLKARDFELIDCQQGTAHLISLGAEPISRKDFIQRLATIDASNTLNGSWTQEFRVTNNE